MLSDKVLKGIGKFLLINVLLYIVTCFVLIYWPLPVKRDVENYDYSSLGKKSSNPSVSKKINIRARDGYDIFTRIYHSDNKSVMILLHGSGSESRYLKRLADSLAQAGMATILTPDLRGHGENPGNKGDIDYIGQLENDIEDLIQYSRKNLNATKIFLAGHSSGGGLILRFIGNSKNTKVDKAILLAPYLGHDAPTVKPGSGNWVTVAVKRWVGLSMLNHIGFGGLNGLPVLFFNRPDAYNDKLQTPSYSYRMAVNFAPRNYKMDIAGIDIPVLVLVGKKDESFYPGRFKEVFEPARRYVSVGLISNANHLNIVSRPESFAYIINWMKQAVL